MKYDRSGNQFIFYFIIIFYDVALVNIFSVLVELSGKLTYAFVVYLSKLKTFPELGNARMLTIRS